MACKNVCKLCDRLIISQAVNYSAAEGIIISLPAGSYLDGEKYCIVIAQAIPTVATISAPVSFSIGTGAGRYPLIDKCCHAVTACGIRTRTKYSTRVVTSATGGSFKLLGNPSCQPNNDRVAIDGT